MRTRIKLCGFTQAPNLHLALEAGVDAIGLNRARGPRLVTLEQAVALSRQITPPVARWLLFVDADPQQILREAAACAASAVQLHGDETPETAELLRRHLPVVKAFRVRDAGTLQAAREYPCDLLLLDAYSASGHGGTGQVFDWRLLQGWDGPPYLLAGGLSPNNVAEAVSALRPWGVDAASGVESSPGVKDPQRMMAFCAAVRQGDLRA